MSVVKPQTTTDERAATGRRALAALLELGIPPTPEHYKLLFAHLGGDNLALSAAIAEVEGHGKRLDATTCTELYDKFLGRSEQAVHRAGHALNQIAARLAQEAASIRQDTQSYSDSLNDFDREMEVAASVPGVRGLLTDLLVETRRMREHAEGLETSLKASVVEIHSLRQDLTSAWREARTDWLTGLANRGSFDRAVHRFATNAVQRAEPLSLILADVDHFKQFNDNHGHRVGDQVLRLISAVLQENIKGKDLASRYGGEEFAILLPQTSLQNAMLLAERLRTTVASRQLSIRDDGRTLGRITLSLGVAEYSPTEPVDDWVERADKALYAAKRGGRNRAVPLSADPRLEPSWAGPARLEPSS